MDPFAEPSAAQWVAQTPVEEMIRVLREYGEERQAGRIARAIERARKEQSITTTAQLAALIMAISEIGPVPPSAK